jgi:hypothetical protein
MITPYLAQQPVTDFAHRFADLKFSSTLAAATDTSLTIPGSARRYKAVIKTNSAGVWVAINGTAAVPGGAPFAATTSELVPANYPLCREVVENDVLHFFQTAGGAGVSVVLYALGTNN